MRKPAAAGGGTTAVVGKPAKPVTAAMWARPGSAAGGGHAAAVPAPAKASSKHSPKAKHQPAKAAKHRKKRGLANVEGGLACCAAQAVGTLLGWDDDEVEALYWLTAAAPDAGASILATLEAAARSGLASCGPTRRRIPDGQPSSAVLPDGAHTAASANLHLGPQLPPLILGVELPGPHAIAVAPDGTWWSWGEPFDPADWPQMVVEEAWAVTWP